MRGIARIARWSTAAMLAVGAIAAFSLSARAQEHPAALNRAETRSLIIAAARLYELDPELLGAIATVESGGNPDAVSPKGARGLMQLMPSTAERFDVENPFDPVDNLLGAVRFINFLKRWQAERPDHTSLAELLAAYNAGPGAVEKYGRVPPYPETQEYIRRVMLAYLLGGDLPQGFRRATRRSRRHEISQQVSEPARPQADLAVASARGRKSDPLDQLSAIQDRRAVEAKRMTAQGWVESHEGQ